VLVRVRGCGDVYKGHGRKGEEEVGKLQIIWVACGFLFFYFLLQTFCFIFAKSRDFGTFCLESALCCYGGIRNVRLEKILST